MQKYSTVSYSEPTWLSNVMTTYFFHISFNIFSQHDESGSQVVWLTLCVLWIYASSLVCSGNGRYCSNFHKDITLVLSESPLLYCVSFTTQTIPLTDNIMSLLWNIYSRSPLLWWWQNCTDARLSNISDYWTVPTLT